MIENPTSLENALVRRAFDDFVGTVENAWFDATEQPYDMTSERGKLSLAKDVAAFANSEDGILVLGARTKSSRTHYGDEVVAVRPFEQARVDGEQYRKVVDEWIYPRVEALEVEWLATTSDPRRGLVVIRVPPQRSEVKPFLVAKTFDGAKFNEALFGYLERHGDANEPLKVADLQRALRVGLHFERTLGGRLSSIEALLQDRRTCDKRPLLRLRR